MGDCQPSAVIFTHARPFAPKELASRVSSSSSFLENSPHPFALRVLIIPPFLTASAKTLKPESFTIAVISFNSRPNLVSGLSSPYLPTASAYVSLGNGSDNFTPIPRSNNSAIRPSISPITSSLSTKLISASICVNSGCLSARRSSSLKHLTIWKYLSNPATIRICLKSWGDWGSAKKCPGLSLLGTR